MTWPSFESPFSRAVHQPLLFAPLFIGPLLLMRPSFNEIRPGVIRRLAMIFPRCTLAGFSRDSSSPILHCRFFHFFSPFCFLYYPRLTGWWFLFHDFFFFPSFFLSFFLSFFFYDIIRPRLKILPGSTALPFLSLSLSLSLSTKKV